MRNRWQEQDVKARFSELIETSLTDGPQIVTGRGVDTAVLISIDQWRRFERIARHSLKALLLAPEALTDALTVPRPTLRRRTAPHFE